MLAIIRSKCYKNVSLKKGFFSPSIRATSPLLKDDMFIGSVSPPPLSPSIRATSPILKDDMFIAKRSTFLFSPIGTICLYDNIQYL